MKKFHHLFLWFQILVLIPLCASVAESEDTLPWAKGGIRIGAFYTGIDSQIRIGLTQGTGMQINLEDTLGLDQSLFAFEGEAYYRFSRNLRHRLDFSYEGYFRNATRNLQEDIIIDGEVIAAGTTVDTVFNIQIIKALYSWSYILDRRVDLAIGGGFYIAPLKLDITGGTIVNKKKSTVPLPVADVRVVVSPAPKWYVRENFDFFYLAIEESSGAIFDNRIGVEYLISKRFGVGVDFRSFRFEITSKEGVPGLVPPDTDISVDYSGLMLFAKYYFR